MEDKPDDSSESAEHYEDLGPENRLKPLYECDRAEGDADLGRLRLGIAASGDLRWAVADTSRPVEALRRRLDPSPVVAVALGRALSAAALLLRFSTKYPGRLRVEVAGDGGIGKMMAEVDSEGFMRAMAGELRFPGVEGDALNVGRAVGSGMFRVTQENERRPEPWVSQTALVSGEIGDDLVHFLNQSQQIRSAALLSTKPGPGGIVAAGGLLVEAMPGCQEARLQRLEQNLQALGDVGGLLEQGGDQALLERVLDGFEIEELEEHTLRYSCNCSRDVLLQRLMALPEDQLNDVAGDDGKAVLECAFCLGQFVFGVGELRSN